MAKKVNITASQFADRWGEGLLGAGSKIEQGVNAVTTAPGQEAAKQKDVWLARIQASADKWAKNTAAVPLEDWKASMIQKGIPNLQNAVNLSKSKVMKAAEKLIPAINSALSSLPKRGTTIDQNMARSTHMAKELRKAFAV